MNCQDASERLDLLALGGLAAAEARAVEEHIAGCESCRRQAEAWRRLVNDARAALAAAREAGPCPARVFTRVDAEIAAARGEPSRRWGARLLRAAAVLLAGLAIAVALRGWRPGPERLSGLSIEWQQGGVAALTAVRYPVVSGGRLVVVQQEDGETAVVAVEKGTGRRVWKTPVRGVVALQADDRCVYAVTAQRGGGAELVALDGADGRERWRRRDEAETPSLARPSLVAVSGGVCWAAGSRIQFLDAATGTPGWTRTLEGRQPALAVGGPDTIVAATGVAVLALRVRNGEPLWIRDLGRDTSIFVRPLLGSGGGRVYLARAVSGPDDRGELTCFDAAKGAMLWSARSATPLSLSVTGDRVYVRSRDLEVFDGASGVPVWSASVVGCGPVAAAEGRVYVVSGRGRQDLVALDAENGHTIWTNHLASSCSGVVLEDGRGYLCGHDGVLYAVAIGGRG